MSIELEILNLADEYELFEYKGAKAYLIINKKMEQYNCLFGFVEFPNDLAVTKELFGRMENRAKEKGFSSLVGPVNYCSWMSYRWAVNRFDIKLFPDCTNLPYYPELIRQMGYRELYTYRSAVIKLPNPLFSVGESIYKQKCHEGFIFRFYEGEEVYQQAKVIFAISENAFRGSYLYCDIPYEYFERIYLAWTKKVKIGLYVAYDRDEPVGYVMGYENPYNHTFISKTSAVKKEFQKQKVYMALHYLGCRYVLDKGYQETVYHFQCEQRDTFQRFDQSVESEEKRYAVYIKEV
ncbi:MAG: hypothetical protein K2H82_10305 [Oscillospiraceae bacterium]|nr:hypothetical protein [Oscillospiraceae bacterium]